jgi:hypothetical protein
MERGRCKVEGWPTRVFFPGESDWAGFQFAVSICESCEVQRECREFARQNGLVDGVYGGTSGRMRRRGRRVA